MTLRRSQAQYWRSHVDDIVKHCWLLDLDRTLSSVEVVMDAVEHVCEAMGLDYGLIAEQKRVTEAHGHSFSAPTVFRSLWPEKLEEFTDRIRIIDHLDCIYPDAKKFLNKLKTENTAHVIITYGDPLWQETKLHFGGVESIPYIICDIPEKSVLLKQYLRDGVFELHTQAGIVRTKSVTLVDDKLEAFEEMPQGSSAVYINRSGKDVSVPPHVREVTSFLDLMEEIQ